MSRARRLAAAGLVAVLGALGGVWAYAGNYGMHVLLRHGGTWWIDVRPDSARLWPSMRLAIGDAPVATLGPVAWRSVADGFEVADLPTLVDVQQVDHVLLARIDPRRFRFEVVTAPAGNRDLDQWMTRLGAALVVNGSYYGRDGRPATPVLSNGLLLGPAD